MNIPIRWAWLWVAISLLVWQPTFTHAQESDTPRIGFIVDTERQFASPNQPGEDGVSRFASIFSQLGAEILTISLNEPILDGIDVAVLIRPRDTLTLRDTAYLHEYLERGGRLLIAVDPDDYAGVDTEINRAGITDLMLNDYSVTFRQDLLVEPWFTVESLGGSDLSGSQMIAAPEDTIPHPVTQPLLQYDLPLQLWGARSLIVEPFGVDNFGSALFYDDTAYGETARRLFATEEADELVFTPEDDVQGRLPIGAIGINTRTSATLVVLGDSEMLMNGFGLDFTNDTARPVYPGNFLFAERLAAWLLNISPANYPALPSGFTWISVDGLENENPDLGVSLSPVSNNDITTIAVYNDHYVYARLTTSEDAVPTGMSFTVASVEGTATQEQVQVAGEIIPDAAFAAGNVVELRLPRRLFNEGLTLENICLVYADENRCQDEVIHLTQLETIEPVPMRIPNTPFGTITSVEQINLRTAPSTQSDVVAVIDPGVQVAILGTDDSSEWVFVRTGGFEGWLATVLVPFNSTVEALATITTE